MIKYFCFKLIDYVFRRKSLISCLFITIAFFLSELAFIGKSQEIIAFCNKIQEQNDGNWKYYASEICKIIYGEGSTIALILSGILIFVLLFFIKRYVLVNNFIDEINQLAFPIPSELICTDLIIRIGSEGLSEYLPELREKYNSNSLLEEHHGKDKNLDQNFPLIDGDVNSSLIETFDGEKIKISLQIGDENGPFINEKRKLIWEFEAKISLNNENTHLLYYLDYQNDQKEYFRLSLGNVNRLDTNGRLRLFNGLKSAYELCGQTVHLGFQVGNNQKLLPPVISINHLAFSDNNSKDYIIEFDVTTTVRHDFTKAKEKSSVLNIKSHHDVIFLTGKIKCMSF